MDKPENDTHVEVRPAGDDDVRDAEEHEIRTQVERSEREMQAFEQKLGTIDSELERLAEKNHQYSLLSKACNTLEELDDAGAATLFWGGYGGSEASQEQLRLARQKIDDHAEEIRRVEAQRNAMLGKIDAQHDVLDSLHYDLRDVIEEEESRRAEWVVEREADEVPYRAQVMPWARGCDEDRQLRKNIVASIAASAVIMLLVSVIDIPILEREQLIELPERVAKLVRQEQQRPTPPPEPQLQPDIPDEQPPDEPRVSGRVA